jgi:hypothetical protein
LSRRYFKSTLLPIRDSATLFSCQTSILAIHPTSALVYLAFSISN